MTEITYEGEDFDDLPMRQFALKFFRASSMRGRVKTSKMIDRVRTFMEAMPSVLLYAREGHEVVGLLFGVVTDDTFTHEPIAMKIHWTWRNGREDVAELLLKEFESWASGEGCTSVISATFSDFASPSKDRMKELGYDEHEIAYRKEI